MKSLIFSLLRHKENQSVKIFSSDSPKLQSAPLQSDNSNDTFRNAAVFQSWPAERELFESQTTSMCPLLDMVFIDLADALVEKQRTDELKFKLQ